MVRLKDIAQKAGVSVMTVSKALRNARDISEATKERIRRIASESGYVPDSMAQGLRTRQTRMFGLVLPSLSDPVHARMATAIEEHAQELGYSTAIAQSMGQSEREEICIRRLMSRRIDGLFVAPVYRLAPKAAVYEELAQSGIPVVVLGQTAPFCAQFVNVEGDDTQGAYQVTQHLIELGHRRIAFLGAPTMIGWARDRLAGYRKALRDNSIEFDDSLVFAAGTGVEEGSTATLQLIQEGRQATAIQAVNDGVAVGAARTLLQQGLRIPEDISLAGYGNLFLSEFFQVPITSVRDQRFRQGAAAFELMGKVISGEKPAARRLPTELVIRRSTGKPPSPPPSTPEPNPAQGDLPTPFPSIEA